MMTFPTLIHKRHMVRPFTNEPVPQETIQRLPVSVLGPRGTCRVREIIPCEGW